MGKFELTVDDVKRMFIYVSKKMLENKDLLTQADKAIGDGDHGVGMARGFGAVFQELENQTFVTVDDVLRKVGLTLMTSIGGASGAIFGTFFKAGGKRLTDNLFDARSLSLFLHDGLQAIKERGGASQGDKTMVDALEPAASKSEELISAPLGEALTTVTEEARKGMEKTKGMVAKIGKAKTLGERAIGYADPGALSTYLILKFMAEYVNG